LANLRIKILVIIAATANGIYNSVSGQIETHTKKLNYTISYKTEEGIKAYLAHHPKLEVHT